MSEIFDEEIQKLYMTKSFEDATHTMLTCPHYRQKLNNFISFTTEFVTDARELASELLILSTAKISKTPVVFSCLLEPNER